MEISKNESIAILEEISKLGDNWDSYGATAFDSKVIQRAKDILEIVTHCPMVFPTGRGSIQFEWENPNGGYLEFEIYADKVTYLWMWNNEDYQNGLIENDSQYNQLISRFFS